MNRQSFDRILRGNPADIIKQLITECPKGTVSDVADYLAAKYPQAWLCDAYHLMYLELKQVCEEDCFIDGPGDKLRDEMDPLWYALDDHSIKEIEHRCRQK